MGLRPVRHRCLHLLPAPQRGSSRLAAAKLARAESTSSTLDLGAGRTSSGARHEHSSANRKVDTVSPPFSPPQQLSSSIAFDIRGFVLGSGVKAERCEQLIRIFEEQEVDREALALLTDDVLRQWGVTVGADRLKLLKAASEAK